MSLIERAVNRAIRVTGRAWPQGDEDLPWFDRPDAEQKASDEDLRKWVRDGYLVVPNAISAELIDSMQADLDSVWTADSPIDGLRIAQLELAGATGEPRHRDLLELDEPARLELRRTQPWRIHGFHTYSANCRAIFEDRGLRELCSRIFDRPAVPSYTINFSFGSEQDLHQDTAVFHVHPRNYLVGAWLACEDVDEGCGPLVYYPGSHRLPLYEEFTNYPQTNLRTCSEETTKRYDQWLEEQSRRFERKLFLANKGDLLLWHGMLIHGGSPITRPGATRRSYVCHYVAEGTDREAQIKGPFNW